MMQENQNKLIKKLIYLSNHRGTRELDIIFGNFSAKYLQHFNEQELDEYNYLLSQQDPDIFDALNNPSEAKEEIKKLSIFKKLLESK